MRPECDLRLVRRCNAFSAFASLFSITVGLSALAGWIFNIAILKSWLPGQVSVRLNAAICFVLLGFAMWVLRKTGDQSFGPGLRFTARVAAAFVALVGSISLLENLTGRYVGLDQIFHKVRAGEEIGSASPGLIPLVASLALGLVGISLLVLDWKTKRGDWPAQFLASAAALSATFGILDFLLGRDVSHTHIALPSALNFLILSFGVICARAEWAIGGLLTSRSLGAHWLRQAAPSALAVFVCFGWLLSKPVLTTAHFSWIEATTIGVSAGLALTLLIGWTAVLLDRSDRQRRTAEEALHLPAERIDRLMDRYDESPVEAGIRRWSMAGIVIGVSLAALGGVSSWQNMRQAAVSDDWVAHTHAVNAALEVILADVVEVESGTRRFAATGNNLFLEPFEAGRRKIPDDLDALANLTSDNPSQQERIQRLRSQIDARTTTAEDSVNERRRRGRVPPSELFLVGKQHMDAVRATIADMQAEEARLLQQRIASAENARQRTVTATLLSTVAGVIVLLFAGIVTRREIGRSGKMRGQILALNLQLERSVGERTVQLRESRERLQGIIESAMDAVVTVDENQRIVLFNAAAENVFRCPSSAAIGQKLDRLIPERFRSRHGVALHEFGHSAETTRQPGSLNTLRGLRADGTEFPMEASISRVEVGGKMLFTAIARDVTERKQADAALRESEERLRALVNASSDVVYRMSSDWSEMHQLDGRGFIADTTAPIKDWLRVYIHPDDQEFVTRTIQDAIRSKNVFELEHRVRQADGSLGWTMSRAVPRLDAKGEIIEWFGMASNVTARKSAEEEVRKLNAELEQRVIQRTAQLEAANKELESFTYSVSHDLRAPLRHIGGFSKILVEEFGPALPQEAKHHLQRIEDGTRRMGMLVDDLLNLARVGRRDLTLQVTGLKTLAEEVISELKPDVGQRHIEWRVGHLPYADCDPALMKQVFQNLLANAVKFTRPRHSAVIEIGCEEREGATILFVRDNGVGFSMKYADKLFGVFQRLHRVEDFDGTGVGLAIVQRIVQKHGGRIWAEAELDKGATFYFSLGNSEKTDLKAKAVTAGEKS